MQTGVDRVFFLKTLAHSSSSVFPVDNVLAAAAHMLLRLAQATPDHAAVIMELLLGNVAQRRSVHSGFFAAIRYELSRMSGTEHIF
tara:strand:- start:681 stop:938 length:258 start_codon:yes stop_codon:yes gene_type:complete